MRENDTPPRRSLRGRLLCALAKRIRYDGAKPYETTPAPTNAPAEINLTSCLLLQTTKCNGEKVNTPVWYSIVDDTIWILTSESSGKVPRARREPIVTVTSCTIRGRPNAEHHLTCKASVVPPDGAIGAEWAMRRTLGIIRNRIHKLTIRDPIYLALRPLTHGREMPEEEALAVGISAVREARRDRGRVPAEAGDAPPDDGHDQPPAA